jgi:hypothetical protein
MGVTPTKSTVFLYVTPCILICSNLISKFSPDNKASIPITNSLHNTAVNIHTIVVDSVNDNDCGLKLWEVHFNLDTYKC